MKKIYLCILTAVSFLTLSTACNDFNDVNDDKEHINSDNMNYDYVFSQVQAQMAGSDWDMWRNGCIYSLVMLQQASTTNWSQGLFYTYTNAYSGAYWDGFYGGGRGAIRNVITLNDKWKDDTNKAYEYQYARVMKAYMMERMTDLYGDVPYSEAGKALSGTGYPKFDAQKDIYNDLLNELDEVNTALLTLSQTSSAETMAYDIFFKGNSERWRKFANSLMLRVAMRLTKVDPTTAATYVKKAVLNGLFTSADEDAVFVRVITDDMVSNDTAEPFGKIISNEDPQAFYPSQYFIDELKLNRDPRIHLIATRVAKPNTKWSDGSDYDYGNSHILDSIHGLPIGFSNSTSNQWSIYDAPGFPYPEQKDAKVKTDWKPYYALFNRNTFARPDGPSLFVTYAQNNLLLAEAAYRGYINGSAEEYFKKGVIAAMEQYSYYKSATELYNTYLNTTNINTYVNSRVIAFSANPLQEINWEYYVLTLGDPYETFSNWRRSGYPEITSVYAAPHNRPAYPNSQSTEIPRRFRYPTDQASVNTANYNAAVSNLDKGDTFSSRVWWDVK